MKLKNDKIIESHILIDVMEFNFSNWSISNKTHQEDQKVIG